MYKATLSFTTKNYDIRKNQLLEDDFTTESEINEFLEIGYIEVYVPSQEVDTSDATSEADDIVVGKTAYAKGEKLTGTFTGVVPTGTKEITENGTVDVSGYANAEVNVSGGSSEYNASITEGQVPTTYSGYPSALKFLKESNANVDLTGYYTAEGFFRNCYSLEKVKSFPIPSVITSMKEFFSTCVKLVTIHEFDTSHITDLTGFAKYCYELVNFPVLDTHLVQPYYMLGMVQGDTKLSDESLNNILYMCANCSSSGSAYRDLNSLGLTQAQATKCTTLSNWPAAQANGWTTGW